MLLNILQCTGRVPTTTRSPNNHCVQNTRGAELKKLFPRQISLSKNLSSIRSQNSQDPSKHTCFDHMVIILIKLKVYSFGNTFNVYIFKVK